MLSTIITLLVTGTIAASPAAPDDARVLMATIETLVEPIEDFRCEFEGSILLKGKQAEGQKLGEGGLSESYSGTFVWKNGGDTRSESFRRRAFDGQVMRDSLVVRVRERQAEHYVRPNDAVVGSAVVREPKQLKAAMTNTLKFIFLVDKLKEIADDEIFDLSVSDDRIDGRPLKVLKVAYKNLPKSPYELYWIDLRRSGQVVRTEHYTADKELRARLEIKLAPFKVGDAEVWMPVKGDFVSYMFDHPPPPATWIVTTEPMAIETMYVVDGTMQFNKHPGREVFTIKYKPGTPISDTLRQLEYQFGQQKIGAKQTRADAEKMLTEQVVAAEEQKRQLIVAPTSEGIPWSGWLTWGLGALLVVSSTVLVIQRRRG